MKRITLLPAFLFTVLFASAQLNTTSQSVYEVLAAANKEWLRQQPDDILLQQNAIFTTDDALIQFHLNRVESRLRAANTDHLTEAQKQNRASCLDHLHDYWVTGRFPKNTHHSERTPYFIDDKGTVCAVGNLMVQTGYSCIANMISEKTNYAYVREMEYPELLAWANEYGFTTDELALVQMPYVGEIEFPTYEWINVDGINIVEDVTAIKVDEVSNRLYIAATFDNFGKGIASYDGSLWTYLGDVNGTVDVITFDNQNVIIGGGFSIVDGVATGNIAQWDGFQWTSLGDGLSGEVKAVARWGSSLYAGGSFGLAKRHGGMWTPVPGGPNGAVNALEVYKNDLYIGGDFSNVGGVQFKNFTSLTTSGPNTFGFNNIGYPSAIYALAAFGDSLFIGGEFITTNDRYGLSAYANGNFNQLTGSFRFGVDDSTFVNSINRVNGRLFVTGRSMYDFQNALYGYFSAEVLRTEWMIGFFDYTLVPMAVAQGSILTTGVYNGANLIGGNFNRLIDAENVNGFVEVSKLAATDKISTIGQVKNNPNLVVVYEPSKTVIKVNDALANGELVLNSMGGKQVLRTQLNDGKLEVNNGSYAPGIYLYSLTANGQTVGSGNLLLR